MTATANEDVSSQRMAKKESDHGVARLNLLARLETIRPVFSAAGPCVCTAVDRVKQHFRAAVRELRTQGAGIIYISHRMEEISALADRVTVLRDGQSVGTRAIREVSRDELIRMMVKADLEAEAEKAERARPR